MVVLLIESRCWIHKDNCNNLACIPRQKRLAMRGKRHKTFFPFLQTIFTQIYFVWCWMLFLPMTQKNSLKEQDGTFILTQENNNRFQDTLYCAATISNIGSHCTWIEVRLIFTMTEECFIQEGINKKIILFSNPLIATFSFC